MTLNPSVLLQCNPFQDRNAKELQVQRVCRRTNESTREILRVSAQSLGENDLELGHSASLFWNRFQSEEKRFLIKGKTFFGKKTHVNFPRGR